MLKKQISLKDPQTKIILISLGIAVAVYISCQKFILKPNKERLVRLKQTLEHITLEDDIGKLYKEVNAYEKTVSPQKDPSWLRVQITELAQKAKLDISSIEPLPPKQIPPYSYVPFKIKSTCTYSQLIEFIRLTESSPNLIAIESLKLKSAREYRLETPEKAPTKQILAEIEVVIGTVY